MGRWTLCKVTSQAVNKACMEAQPNALIFPSSGEVSTVEFDPSTGSAVIGSHEPVWIEWPIQGDAEPMFVSRLP